jgi:formate hydrogenlyase subunit 4
MTGGSKRKNGKSQKNFVVLFVVITVLIGWARLIQDVWMTLFQYELNGIVSFILSMFVMLIVIKSIPDDV